MWFIKLVKTIGDMPNTFWGIIILGASMYVAVKYNLQAGYYFAGVGSTLLGIQQHPQQPNTITTVGQGTLTPSVKVESNASDTPSQD